MHAESDYNSHLLSSYSFKDDFAFLHTSSHQFFVIPKEKRNAFIGRASSPFKHVGRNVHIMWNTSFVWTIGGIKYQFMRKGTKYITKFEVGQANQTWILDLKYVH